MDQRPEVPETCPETGQPFPPSDDPTAFFVDCEAPSATRGTCMRYLLTTVAMREMHSQAPDLSLAADAHQCRECGSWCVAPGSDE